MGDMLALGFGLVCFFFVFFGLGVADDVGLSLGAGEGDCAKTAAVQNMDRVNRRISFFIWLAC